MSDRLTQLFAQGLGVAETGLSDDTSPENTPQWDSLAAMTMVTLIEEEFSVRLKARDVMRMRTIGLAREVLAEKGVALSP